MRAFRKKTTRMRSMGVVLLCLVCCRGVSSQEYANDSNVGIDPKLGQLVPLDLTFSDEEGKPVKLGSLMTRPTVLILVYFRCPSICSPIMREVASTVDKVDLVAGVDYNLLTISFDNQEKLDLVQRAKKNLLAEMQTKIPPDSWRFLRGDAANIATLTDRVGYRFKKIDQDFNHPSSIMVLSKEGKIVRYLPGLRMLPSHLKMALLDAEKGIPRSFMQRIERLCFSYDSEGQTYVFKVNRIVLGVTVFGLAVFLAYLLLFKKKVRSEPVGGDTRSGGQG